MCLSKAGLAIAGTTSRARTNAPNGAGVDFAINGYLYHLGDADNNVIFTAAIQAALTSVIYLVSVNASNTVVVTAGSAVTTTAVAAGTSPLIWPDPPAGYCPIGAIRVDSGAGAFTAGTTALTGGTVTATYYDLFAVPDAPIVA